MTLFISNKNQELLWKVINKNEKVYDMDIDFKTEWFKQNIEIFFDMYKDIKIKKKDVQKINKEFMKKIASDIKYIISWEEKNVEEIKERNNEEESNVNFLESMNDRMVPKSESLNNEYENRQLEYNDLLNSKPPDQIDFSEKFEEEKITDIEELMEKERQQRQEVDNEAHRMYEDYINKNNLKKDENIEVIEPN
jgi:hypothetical protein